MQNCEANNEYRESFIPKNVEAIEADIGIDEMMEIEDEKDYDLWTEKYKPKTTM